MYDNNSEFCQKKILLEWNFVSSTIIFRPVFVSLLDGELILADMKANLPFVTLTMAPEPRCSLGKYSSSYYLLANVLRNIHMLLIPGTINDGWRYRRFHKIYAILLILKVPIAVKRRCFLNFCFTFYFLYLCKKKIHSFFSFTNIIRIF